MCRGASRSVPCALRSVGVDAGSFGPRWGLRGCPTTYLVAAFFVGLRLDEVRIATITVDGLDVTSAMQRLLSRRTFDLVLLSGLCYAGFNVVDLDVLRERFGRPLLAVSADRPDHVAVLRALKKHFNDWRARSRFLSVAGPVRRLSRGSHQGPLFFSTSGIPPIAARRVLRSFCVVTGFPEPLRVAKLIAHGLTRRSALLRHRREV